MTTDDDTKDSLAGRAAGSLRQPAASSQSEVETAEASTPVSLPGDIEVELVFEVGSRSMALGELVTLKTGFCFGLDRPVDSPVLIRANGKPVARGSMVDVEGRIGVKITESLL